MREYLIPAHMSHRTLTRSMGIPVLLQTVEPTHSAGSVLPFIYVFAVSCPRSPRRVCVGFLSCSERGLLLVAVCMGFRLQWLPCGACGMWGLPRARIEPVLVGGILTTAPPRKSWICLAFCPVPFILVIPI